MLSYHPLFTKDEFLKKNPCPGVCLDSSACITPGLVDLQVNGVAGVDFSSLKPEDMSAESLKKAGLLLASHGVTRFLASKISSPITSYTPDFFTSFLSEWNSFPYAQCFGWHLEGPYLNPIVARAHSREWLNKPFEKELFKEIFSTGAIKLVTLAPEIPQGRMMLELASEYGITTSLGHTVGLEKDLGYAQTKKCSMVTHLYNAMPAFHHRESGIVGYVLGKKDLFYTIISDLVHVDEGALRMAFNASPEKLILTSDLSPLAGSQSERCRFGTSFIIRDQMKSYTEEGELAGSLLFLDEQMISFINATGCSFEYALTCATKKPFQLVQKNAFCKGYFDVCSEKVCCDKKSSVHCDSLTPSSKKMTLPASCNEKDVLLWNKGHILAVWVNGRLCYSAG